ncbi:hypothetical protein ACFP2T_15315 [Plantactinospora solaniradicis]|uniref:Uncharacterized protein n=1 Tax=Plantactinospora solaniradicis TaxID=1723736 RepID=A0ABW1K6V5_9ACTN
MRNLPTLPGCGQPSTTRIEIYTPTATAAHGSFDGAAYGCDRHAMEIVSALQVAGFTPHRDPSPVDVSTWPCGRVFTFSAPVEPAGVVSPIGDTTTTGVTPVVAASGAVTAPSDADVAAFIAANKVPLPSGHPRWCHRNDTDRTHRSTLFRVTDRIALQIEQPHVGGEPAITLLDGIAPRSVRYPLDVAQSLSRQLRVAVSLAGMDLR